MNDLTNIYTVAGMLAKVSLRMIAHYNSQKGSTNK